MLLAAAVVVWEWLNEHGRWRPYSPAVSHRIEAAVRSSDPRGGSVVLGQVDSRLSPYIIDLQSMHQFRLDTGTIRPVRRCFYEPCSAPAQGVQWEWESSTGAWMPYDMEAAITIHMAHGRHQARLDLEPFGLTHLIDFHNMTQVNRQSRRCRRVRQRADMCYPLVSGPLPHGVSRVGGGGGALLGVGVTGSSTGPLHSPNPPILGQAAQSPSCGCQQCLLVQSVKSGQVQTLGRSHKKPPSSPAEALSRFATLGSAPRQSCDWPLPHGLAICRNTASPRQNAQLFAQSLAALAASSALATGSALSADKPKTKVQSNARPVPIATLVTPASMVTTPPSPVPSPSPVVMKPDCQGSHPLLPWRSSLAGLSRPALQRIAWAQNRTLLAAGVPMVPVKNLKPSSLIQPALAGITGTLMSAAGLPVVLTRRPDDHPIVPKNLLRPVPGFTRCCLKTSKKQARKGRSPEEVVRRYVQKVKKTPDQDCTICMEPLGGPSGYAGPRTGPAGFRPDTAARLVQCGHIQHLGCLVAQYSAGAKDGRLQCPTCQVVYGVKTGNQPAGKMQFHSIPNSLPGHLQSRTIRIIYTIPSGIQGREDVNPGQPFTARGFPRRCYIPDTPRGRQVLALLLIAWERGLLFTVGTSSTTGGDDTVVWNQVHHKTEFGSNGYPDPVHLDSVMDQLRALGIGSVPTSDPATRPVSG